MVRSVNAKRKKGAMVQTPAMDIETALGKGQKGAPLRRVALHIYFTEVDRNEDAFLKEIKTRAPKTQVREILQDHYPSLQLPPEPDESNAVGKHFPPTPALVTAPTQPQPPTNPIATAEDFLFMALAHSCFDELREDFYDARLDHNRVCGACLWFRDMGSRDEEVADGFRCRCCAQGLHSPWSGSCDQRWQLKFKGFNALCNDMCLAAYEESAAANKSQASFRRDHMDRLHLRISAYLSIELVCSEIMPLTKGWKARRLDFVKGFFNRAAKKTIAAFRTWTLGVYSSVTDHNEVGGKLSDRSKINSLVKAMAEAGIDIEGDQPPPQPKPF